ncbi:DUF6773 family protein [Desulfosporosinus meridiei]|uniref:Uncharacterized protein n=1 Tax=Desulfosporosinus meridiei (strain ATCC BAA-275 / DSM 13257 / KCTC 12902 / NCIMB 13706 / S10) TaxID=768704 RepID=J7IS27_DESMD|nr:DUF6773 family protein [Desulfosporosinus meridiei]AFQ44677.1 hypothetical protein Desmer_2769 [Desulfosporosinus meridiei DSM 13257]
MHKSELDEMQLQKRNMIGNQAYMILFYLLLLDIGLYGFGFRWLNYPMNVVVIINACMAYYLVRIIWNKSYVGPKVKAKSLGRRIGIVIGLAGLVAGITSIFLKSGSVLTVSTEDNSAMILLIVSVVLLIMLAVVSLISKWQARSDE